MVKKLMVLIVMCGFLGGCYLNRPPEEVSVGLGNCMCQQAGSELWTIEYLDALEEFLFRCANGKTILIDYDATIIGCNR